MTHLAKRLPLNTHLALEAKERLEYEEGQLLAMAGDSQGQDLQVTRLPLLHRKTPQGVVYEVHREGSLALDFPEGELPLARYP